MKKFKLALWALIGLPAYLVLMLVIWKYLPWWALIPLTILMFLIPLWKIGYYYGRFWFKLGTGEMVARSYGKDGEIIDFQVLERDYDRVLRIFKFVQTLIDSIIITERRRNAKKDTPIPEAVALKTASQEKLREMRDFWTNSVSIAGGPLRIFNLFSMSYLNPAVTLHGVDNGKLMEDDPDNPGQQRPVKRFQFISSPEEEFPGIDVSGHGKEGTFPITVAAQIPTLFFILGFKVFAQEENTAGQIYKQFKSAVNLLCANHSSDDIESRNFTPEQMQRALLQFLLTGMIADALIVTDFKLDESPAIQAAEMERAKAVIEAGTAKTVAQGKADATRIRGVGEAAAITAVGDAETVIMGKKKEVLEGLDVDLARALALPNHPLGPLPVGADIYTLGADRIQGPEVWRESVKKDKKPEIEIPA